MDKINRFFFENILGAKIAKASAPLKNYRNFLLFIIPLSFKGFFVLVSLLIQCCKFTCSIRHFCRSLHMRHSYFGFAFSDLSDTKLKTFFSSKSFLFHYLL